MLEVRRLQRHSTHQRTHAAADKCARAPHRSDAPPARGAGVALGRGDAAGNAPLRGVSAAERSANSDWKGSDGAGATARGTGRGAGYFDAAAVCLGGGASIAAAEAFANSSPSWQMKANEVATGHSTIEPPSAFANSSPLVSISSAGDLLVVHANSEKKTNSSTTSHGQR